LKRHKPEGTTASLNLAYGSYLYIGPPDLQTGVVVSNFINKENLLYVDFIIKYSNVVFRVIVLINYIQKSAALRIILRGLVGKTDPVAQKASLHRVRRSA